MRLRPLTGWDALEGHPRRRLKMTDEDVARVGRELDAGHAAVGVLTWDFKTEEVAEKLRTWADPRAHEVAKVTAGVH